MAVAGVELARAWGRERARWRGYYQQQLADRLDWAVDYVQRSQPSELRAHLDSLLTLLRRARPHPHLYPRMVALIAALHPWPLRWLRWEAWEREIRFAIQVYADLKQPQRQAEFQSYLAKLLFDTGRLDEALAVGEEALTLARAHDTIMPLYKASPRRAVTSGRQTEAARTWMCISPFLHGRSSFSTTSNTSGPPCLRTIRLRYFMTFSPRNRAPTRSKAPTPPSRRDGWSTSGYNPTSRRSSRPR